MRSDRAESPKSLKTEAEQDIITTDMVVTGGSAIRGHYESKAIVRDDPQTALRGLTCPEKST